MTTTQMQAHSLLGPTAWSRTLQPGETLFLEGEMPNAVYVVVEGFVKMTWASPGGRETIAELLLPGDVFDLPSCLDGCAYPLSCKAPSNSTAKLAVVSRGALLEDPELFRRCQLRLVQQLRRQRSNPVAAAAERVEVRVARALIWLAESLGARVGTKIILPFAMTRQEIAEWVGTTTETVIRVCSQLRRRGLIDLEKGQLTLLQPAEMQHLTEAA